MQAPKDGSRRGGHPLRALVSVALAAMLLFAAGRADAFCTIAGGCAPTGTGHLDITHIGPDQEPVDLAVGVYFRGSAAGAMEPDRVGADRRTDRTPGRDL